MRLSSLYVIGRAFVDYSSKDKICFETLTIETYGISIQQKLSWPTISWYLFKNYLSLADGWACRMKWAYVMNFSAIIASMSYSFCSAFKGSFFSFAKIFAITFSASTFYFLFKLTFIFSLSSPLRSKS